MAGLSIFCLLVLCSFSSTVFGDLACPLGIQSFSNGARSNTYYACEKGERQPVVKKCEPGSYYWAYKQACHRADNGPKTADTSDLAVYSRPALGATILLGDLYNSNTDEFLTGYSFWKRSTVLSNQIKTVSPSASVNIFAASSTLDRLQRTAFSSAIKLGILGDLIQVKGSTAYLKDTLESEKHLAVLLTHQATTHTETLPVDTPIDHDHCGVNGPTHVITGITNGIGANFVYKKIVGDDENANDILKDLKMVVNAVPTTKGDISDQVKKIVKNVHVNFYSDFLGEKQPTNYEESVHVYQSLSLRFQQLQKEVNSTVSMEIELMPLTTLCKDKKISHVAVSENILNRISKMLSQMDKTKLIINTLIMEKAVQDYLPMRKILETLFEELTSFEFQMKKDLRILLPRIHHGNSSEEELVRLLNKYTASPFYYDTVESFLDNRRREINMLDFMLNPKKLEGTDIKVLSYKQASDIEIMFSKPYVLQLRYNVLPSKQIVRKFLSGEVIDESKSWYNDPHVVSLMGVQFSKFVKFSSSNKNSKNRGYLLAITDAKHEAVEVKAQKEGLLYEFVLPEEPPAMAAISNTHNSITFNLIRPFNTWITGFRVSYQQYGSHEERTSKPYRFSKNNITTIEIEEIMANTIYQFSLNYVTPMGLSTPGPTSYFGTRPCSTPTNVRTSELGADHVNIDWDPPFTCGEGVHIRKYKVTVTGANKFSRIMIVEGATNATVGKLEAASKYNIFIQAMLDKQKLNRTENDDILLSLPSTLSVITRPCSTPTNVRTSELGADYVNIDWDPPTTCEEGVHIRKYKVTVTGAIKFSRIMIVEGATNATVGRLQAASKYNISIQAMLDKQKLNRTETEDILLSLPSTLSVIIRPEAPSRLSMVQRSTHKVVVKWEAIKKVAVGAVLQKYQLRYQIKNNVGNISQEGTAMVVSTSNTSHHINDLIQGTTYSVSVKVLTSKGDSDYSPNLIMKTMFQKSELDILWESLNHSVSAIESEITKINDTIASHGAKINTNGAKIDTNGAKIDTNGAKIDTNRAKIDTNGVSIKSISNTPLLMVYYPRLRSEGYSVSDVSGCGGTINTAGRISFPTQDWCAYQYRSGEDCSWNINTGMPTTLKFNGAYSFSTNDYVQVYDEELYIGQYQDTEARKNPTIKIRSGNAHVKFHSDQSTASLSYGFKLDISVTNVRRIAAQRYYPKYKATFTAYGSPSSYTEHYTWNNLPKANTSIPACIKDCNGRYLKDKAWNEVSIELDTDPLQCTCYKNATGFTYYLSKFHYRMG